MIHLVSVLSIDFAMNFLRPVPVDKLVFLDSRGQSGKMDAPAGKNLFHREYIHSCSSDLPSGSGNRLALIAISSAGRACPHMFSTPFRKLKQDRYNAFPFFRQCIFHPGRHFIILFAVNDTGRFQIFEGLGQHHIGNTVQLSSDTAVPRRIPTRKHTEDRQLPLAPYNIKRIADRAEQILTCL